MSGTGACQMHDGLMEYDGIWRGLDHISTGIANRTIEPRLDHAQWSTNQGERRWALVGDVEKS